MIGRGRGVTLIEVVVALVILGIVMLAFMQFQTGTSKMVRMTTDQAAFTRAMSAIERDVMRDVPFLPPQDEDDVDPNTKAFDNPDKSEMRCYDRTGGRAPSCENFDKSQVLYFRASYFKSRVRDQSVDPASPFGRVPISRVRFRVDHKVNDKVQPPYQFGRVQTDVLRY